MPFNTYADLVAQAKSRIREVSVTEALALRQPAAGVVFLDVREPQEANLGTIPGAIFLPRGQLEGHIEGLVPRDARVVIYCSRGNRSALAADTMQQMGYTNVASLAGGFGDWVAAGGDVE